MFVSYYHKFDSAKIIKICDFRNIFHDFLYKTFHRIVRIFIW